MNYRKEAANKCRGLCQSGTCDDTVKYRKNRGGKKPFYLEEKLRDGVECWGWMKHREKELRQWHKVWNNYKTLKAAQEACNHFNNARDKYHNRYEYRVASHCIVVIGESK